MWRKITNREIVYFVLAVCIKCCNCHNFFIINQYEGAKFYCITDSSYALSWVIDDTSVSKDFQQASRFLPKFQNFWTITEEDIKQNNWKHNKTFSDEIILDRRWEKINIDKTDYVDKDSKSPLKFTTVATSLTSDFKIPFSIRIDEEAHIFLCDGQDVTSSNCYWLILQGFHGTRSAIRKCPSSTIPSINGDEIQWSCKKFKTVREHDDPNSPKYLSAKQWNHFMLSKISNTLALTHANGIPVLSYTDQEDDYDITHILVHSKYNFGLWKFHDIEYFFTEEEKQVQFQKPIPVIDGTVCISMFVKMCNSCKIQLEATDVGNSNNLIKQIFTHENSGWQEIKFQKENIVSKDIYLKLTTRNKANTNSFWKISDLTQCGKNGFRMIELDDMANCQLVSDEEEIISLNESKGVSATSVRKCKENEISTHCVPCSWFVKDKCAQLKICEKHDDFEGCFCSAGYNLKERTNQCVECGNGKYGHSCTNTCTRNCKNCNHVDGICDRCTDQYSGLKCDIPPIYFTRAPNITNFEYTAATIHVQHFDLTGKTSSKTYVIQYKESNKSWTTTKNIYNIGETVDVELNDLKPGLTYSVRCVIATENTVYTHENIPTVEFITKCDKVRDEDIIALPSNTSAIISVTQENQQRVCPFDNFLVRVITTNRPNSFSYKCFSYYIVLNGLKPFENYEIAITTEPTTEIRKSFKTTEGIPEKVSDLNTSLNGTSVYLSWKKPSQINGLLTHFTVRYRVYQYSACRTQNLEIHDDKEIPTTNEHIIVSNVIPFSKTQFSVSASNAKYEGFPETIILTIPKSSFIYDNEIPKWQLSNPKNRDVSIEFSAINCTLMRGPLQIILNANCLEEWCKNVTEAVDYPNNLYATLSGLSLFTNYTLELNFCRPDGNCHLKVDKAYFQTEPGTPNPVRNLTIYSKNHNSISVRWEPPYPPNGMLELYNIGYYTENKSYSKNVTNSPCHLWPQFQCITLENLSENTLYWIDIMAKNKIPARYGQQQSTKNITKTEPSKKPPDLEIRWSLQNDLKISWKHPVEANGDIDKFKISILSKDPNETKNIRRILNVTKDTYKPLYHHTVEAEELIASTNYKVTVTAYNGCDGEPSYTQFSSLPEIPLLEKDPIFKFSSERVDVEASKIRNVKKGHTYKILLLIPNDKIDSSTHSEELKHLETNFDVKTSHLKIVDRCEYTEAEKVPSEDNKRKCPYNLKANLTSEDQNVTVLLVHTDQNSQSSYKLYSFSKQGTNPTADDTASNLGLLALLALLLLIPAAIIIFMKRHVISDKVSSFKKNIFGVASLDIETSAEEGPLATYEKQSKSKNPKLYFKRIAITDFEQYVKESLNNGELERQHSLFPRGQTKPWNCGALKENKSKNRYTNLMAYDHTRVVLAKIKGEEHSDYINANYIDGYKVPKAYIATQGPKLTTTNDFWRMIWQENVQHIAMLANVFEAGKKKVEKYWPERNETLPFGNISVRFNSSQVFTDYEHRIFEVTCQNESRTIHQYHFSSWPDHGVPLYCQSLVPFLETLQTITPDSKSPIVVHCSAGVGRTGTILLCDICLRMVAEENAVDVLRTIQLLRDQRPNMVDNIQQYKLAHLVILEYLLGLKTGIPCNKISPEIDKLIRNGEIKNQMRYLESTAWQDQAMKAVVPKKEVLNVVKEKNRFQTIIPEIQGSIFLSRYPIEDETSTYINAIKVDGFQNPERFIVTQQPMPNTSGDFWRLIHEKDISVVISLTEVNLKNKTCCSFWPSETRNELKPVDYLTLKHASTRSLETHDLIDIHMHINRSEEYKIIEIVSFKGWPAKTSCPKKIETFLSFWEETNAISRKSDSVVVTCFDGAMASGLYVALSFVIEKMKLEQICDVCRAVRTIRHNRSQFVSSEEQFEFLYRAAVTYINEFEFYSNFQ